MKKKSRKSRFTLWVQKIFIIPSYEKELKSKNEEIQDLTREKEYMQSLMYKYKNKVIKLKKEEAKKNDNN